MVKPEIAQQPGALCGGTLSSEHQTWGELHVKTGTWRHKIVWKYKHFYGYVHPWGCPPELGNKHTNLDTCRDTKQAPHQSQKYYREVEAHRTDNINLGVSHMRRLNIRHWTKYCGNEILLVTQLWPQIKAYA